MNVYGAPGLLNGSDGFDNGTDDFNGHRLGRDIFQRIAAKESNALQAQFLELLNGHPAAQYLTLCDGAALHGVYLHTRRSADLNFEAPTAVARHFPQLTHDLGPRFVPSNETNRYLFSGRVAVLSSVTIQVTVTPRMNLPPSPEERQFVAASGRSVTVRVAPLSDLLLTTLGRLLSGPHPVDLFDCWSILKSVPATREEIRKALGTEAGFDGRRFIYPPRDLLMEHIWRLRGTWGPTLTAIVPALPAFSQIFRDLRSWLRSEES